VNTNLELQKYIVDNKAQKSATIAGNISSRKQVDCMTLGSKVKEIREAKGWSQGRLAKYSGLTRSYLSPVELDHYKTLGGAALVNLSAALGVMEDVLLEASGLKPSLSGRAKTELENFTAWLAAKEPNRVKSSYKK
jgi:transcriptional regulator with XRE-family HTH domain